MEKLEKGKIIEATITGIKSYGIFVSTIDNYTGLIHISNISYGFVKNINKYGKIGDNILVLIIGIDDEKKHLKLSLKDLNKRKNLKETNLGFSSLAEKLPLWIEDSINNYKCTSKC